MIHQRAVTYLNRLWSPATSAARVRQSLWPLVQIAVAAVSSFLLAQAIIGTASPILAAIVATVSLGFSRDTSFSRVVETVLAMLAGITVSTSLLLMVGDGTWQLLLAVLVAGFLARAFTSNSTLAVTMIIQALLVQSLPEPDAGYVSRAVEGLIGGGIALLFSALLPRNPVKMVRDAEAVVFTEMRENIALLRTILDSPTSIDDPYAGWERSKSLSVLMDEWRTVLISAENISRVSPFYRRYLEEVHESAARQEALDLAVRNLRMLARRIGYLPHDEPARGGYSILLARFAAGITLIEIGSQDFSARRKAQKEFRKLAKKLAVPKDGQASVSSIGMLMQLRPFWVDLAVAAGLPREEARQALP